MQNEPIAPPSCERTRCTSCSLGYRRVRYWPLGTSTVMTAFTRADSDHHTEPPGSVAIHGDPWGGFGMDGNARSVFGSPIVSAAFRRRPQGKVAIMATLRGVCRASSGRRFWHTERDRRHPEYPACHPECRPRHPDRREGSPRGGDSCPKPWFYPGVERFSNPFQAEPAALASRPWSRSVIALRAIAGQKRPARGPRR